MLNKIKNLTLFFAIACIKMHAGITNEANLIFSQRMQSEVSCQEELRLLRNAIHVADLNDQEQIYYMESTKPLDTAKSLLSTQIEALPIQIQTQLHSSTSTALILLSAICSDDLNGRNATKAIIEKTNPEEELIESIKETLAELDSDNPGFATTTTTNYNFKQLQIALSKKTNTATITSLTNQMINDLEQFDLAVPATVKNSNIIYIISGLMALNGVYNNKNPIQQNYYYTFSWWKAGILSAFTVGLIILIYFLAVQPTTTINKVDPNFVANAINNYTDQAAHPFLMHSDYGVADGTQQLQDWHISIYNKTISNLPQMFVMRSSFLNSIIYTYQDTQASLEEMEIVISQIQQAFQKINDAGYVINKAKIYALIDKLTAAYNPNKAQLDELAQIRNAIE